MKRTAAAIALAAFMGFGSTRAAQAQSFALPGAVGSVAVAEVVPSEAPAPPLFAKLTMPPETRTWPAPRVFTSRGPVLPFLYVSLVGLQGYDGYSTTVGLQKGAVEGNGFMTTLVTHPAALWAVKGGTAVASIYAAERLWRQGRRGQAIAVMIASNALMVGVAANNASIVRSLK